MTFVGIYYEWALFILMMASGIICAIDHFFFYKKRKALAESAPDFAKLTKKQKHERMKGPFMTDYARSLFWVFVIVFALRSFVFQPYIVPSGSMLPTIQLNDFVVVNEFSYGIRLPLGSGAKIISVGEPERGDVVVFKNPVNPQTNFIKTVIGLPGDKISYINKQLFVNGKAISQTFVQNTVEPSNVNLGSPVVAEYTNQIGDHVHTIYTSPNVPPQDFQNLLVPQGEYFMMGDNRDDSDDSRTWGFVPEANLIGRASYIFFSVNSDNHSVRWNRIGMKLP